MQLINSVPHLGNFRRLKQNNVETYINTFRSTNLTFYAILRTNT